MKLLLIGPRVTEFSDIRNFSGLWSFYLGKELERRGVELAWTPTIHMKDGADKEKESWARNLDIQGADHILALGTRMFTRLPYSCGYILREKLHKAGKGLLTQIHDGPLIKTSADVTFHLKVNKSVERRTPHGNINQWIGWAADHLLLFPEQPHSCLSILIDHPNLISHNDKETEDWTDELSQQVRSFIQSPLWEKHGWGSVIVRKMVDRGYVVLNPNEPWEKAKAYQRLTIPFQKIVPVYRTTHLFFVTHPESVGMSILETAMCGALPVMRKDAANRWLVENTVRALQYTGEKIPWEDALSMIDIEASQRKASTNTWAAVVERILTFFNEY